ncbi:MAG: hypothetical protein F6K53_04485 [Moorea sp. SIO4A1]|nr:hypothetical protein [Moorena sp. SIO4A5]NEQ56703.1 hypothetical protein [Moorena sp. SIO4A1]
MGRWGDGEMSLFPVPCSLFPTPDSLFPIPDSRLPTPDSLKPKTKVPHPMYNGKIRHSTHGTNWFNSAQASVFGANRIPS